MSVVQQALFQETDPRADIDRMAEAMLHKWGGPYVPAWAKEKTSWEHTLMPKQEALVRSAVAELPAGDLSVKAFYNWVRKNTTEKVPYSVFHLVRTVLYGASLASQEKKGEGPYFQDVSLVEAFEPELLLLSALDGRYAEAAVRLLETVGENFKLYPASSTHRYHPPDEDSLGGKLFHTKRACAYFVRWILPYLLDPAYRSGRVLFTKRDLTVGLFSLILHDLFCAGPEFPPVMNEDKEAYKNHPYFHRQVWGGVWHPLSREETEEALVCIENHMGRWSLPGRRHPENSVSFYVHLADFVPSRDFIFIAPLSHIEAQGYGAKLARCVT